MSLPRECRTAWGRPKRCFRTMEQAEVHARRFTGLRAYHCTHCGNYHTATDVEPGDRPALTEQEVEAALRRTRRGRRRRT